MPEKTPIADAGHTDLRAYIMATWIWFEIRNEEGTAILRIEIDSDPRVEWTEEGEVLKVTGTFSGTDEEFGDVEETPVTVQYSAIFKVEEEGDALDLKELTPFTFVNDADELIIEHYIEIPQQV